MSKKFLQLIFLATFFASGFSALGMDPQTQRPNFKTRINLVLLRKIEVKNVGDVVCVTNQCSDNTGYLAQPSCGFWLNYIQHYNQQTYEIYKEGWFSNDEKVIKTKVVKEEKTKFINYAGNEHRTQVSTFSQGLTQDPLEALASNADKMVFNNLATTALEQDLKNQKNLCEAHQKFLSDYAGKETVLPEGFRF